MENTGERHIVDEIITDEAEFYNHLMHLATYHYAEQFVKGKRILDYGCGSGYGSQLLSTWASEVTAVDVSQEAITFAKERYNSPNIHFCEISELKEEQYDVITSFQVIEHVPNDKKYVEKLYKLLKPGGVLLITTPDKKHRAFGAIQKPWNIYHLKEYSSQGLKGLLLKHFKSVELLQIGSSKDFVKKEIARTKKQRIVTLPCTLAIYPNFLRKLLLQTQAKMYRVFNRLRREKVNILNEKESNNDLNLQYNIKDILFEKELVFSTDLLAICQKSEQ